MDRDCITGLTREEAVKWWRDVTLDQKFRYDIESNTSESKLRISVRYNSQREEYSVSIMEWQRIRSPIKAEKYIRDKMIVGLNDYKVEYGLRETSTAKGLQKLMMKIMNPVIGFTLTRSVLDLSQTIEVLYSEGGQYFTVENRRFELYSTVDLAWSRVHYYLQESYFEKIRVEKRPDCLNVGLSTQMEV